MKVAETMGTKTMGTVGKTKRTVAKTVSTVGETVCAIAETLRAIGDGTVSKRSSYNCRVNEWTAVRNRAAVG
ncbi:unnamed protein product [Parnassius apollo]|uniref:(apollo) hypothetical protein n=1 Tax=Parnassius apollo TaxID=110799 RepID=A0A8S3X1Z5_PARAO|nr:unnamed protein product [Parnassius apollo]